MCVVSSPFTSVLPITCPTLADTDASLLFTTRTTRPQVASDTRDQDPTLGPEPLGRCVGGREWET